jgi:hypothetical protein
VTLYNEERRPLGKADGAEENFTLTPSLAVTGLLRVDLRRGDDRDVGRLIRDAADDAPPGAVVEFELGRRQLLPTFSDVDYFRRAARERQLRVTIASGVACVANRWIRAFRDGEMIA